MGADEHRYLDCCIYECETQLTLNTGTTTLIAGGMNSADNESTVYAFLTARILDLQGSPIRKPEIIEYKGKPPDNKDKIETRFLSHPWFSVHYDLKNRPSKDELDQGIKDEFAKEGVPWPKGSSVSYFREINLMKICNTPDNLERFKQLFKDCYGAFRMISIQTDFVQFNLQDIDFTT